MWCQALGPGDALYFAEFFYYVPLRMSPVSEQAGTGELHVWDLDVWCSIPLLFSPGRSRKDTNAVTIATQAQNQSICHIVLWHNLEPVLTLTIQPSCSRIEYPSILLLIRYAYLLIQDSPLAHLFIWFSWKRSTGWPSFHHTSILRLLIRISPLVRLSLTFENTGYKRPQHLHLPYLGCLT